MLHEKFKKLNCLLRVCEKVFLVHSIWIFGKAFSSVRCSEGYISTTIILWCACKTNCVRQGLSLNEDLLLGMRSNNGRRTLITFSSTQLSTTSRTNRQTCCTIPNRKWCNGTLRTYKVSQKQSVDLCDLTIYNMHQTEQWAKVLKWSYKSILSFTWTP